MLGLHRTTQLCMSHTCRRAILQLAPISTATGRGIQSLKPISRSAFHRSLQQIQTHYCRSRLLHTTSVTADYVKAKEDTKSKQFDYDEADDALQSILSKTTEKFSKPDSDRSIDVDVPRHSARSTSDADRSEDPYEEDYEESKKKRLRDLSLEDPRVDHSGPEPVKQKRSSLFDRDDGQSMFAGRSERYEGRAPRQRDGDEFRPRQTERSTFRPNERQHYNQHSRHMSEFGEDEYLDEEEDKESGHRSAEFMDGEGEKEKGKFSNFNISEESVRRLQESGINHLFGVQVDTYQHVYGGQDTIIQARTGTGKTLAFALPLVEKLTEKEVNRRRGRTPQILVLLPTRELANQVGSVFMSLGNRLSTLCVYGGVSIDRQENQLQKGVDVLVGTPGRIMDLMNRGMLDLGDLKHVVLDEVDRMLDMGFAPDVDKILNKTYSGGGAKPQTLLFSATVPKWVKQASRKYLDHDVVHVNLVGKHQVRTATKVEHLAIACSRDKVDMVSDLLRVYSGEDGKAIVFCETKVEANRISYSLEQDTHVLHGDIAQHTREQVLKSFKNGQYNALVTTDVASRGLDIPEVDLIIQCQPPKDADSYIHRSGRTGRAGRSGLSVCLYEPYEQENLRRVERAAGIKFQKIRPPSAKEISESSINDAIKSLSAVSADAKKPFRSVAETAIQDQGAIDCLSAALAIITKSTDGAQRSLLSSRKGFTTFHFQGDMELNSLGYVWSILELCIPPNVKSKISQMTMCADKMGAVFDVPNNSKDDIEKNWQDNGNNKLQVAETLPELQERRRDFSGQSRGGYGQNRGGYGQNRGGYGQNRGGYGQNRGGYGQDRGGYGQNRGGYGQDRSGYGQNRGGYGQDRRGGSRYQENREQSGSSSGYGGGRSQKYTGNWWENEDV